LDLGALLETAFNTVHIFRLRKSAFENVNGKKSCLLMKNWHIVLFGKHYTLN